MNNRVNGVRTEIINIDIKHRVKLVKYSQGLETIFLTNELTDKDIEEYEGKKKNEEKGGKKGKKENEMNETNETKEK